MNTRNMMQFRDRKPFNWTLSTFVAWLSFAGVSLAQQTMESRIAPKIDESVVAVAYLDLNDLQLDGAFEKLVDVGLIADAEKIFYEGMKLEMQEKVDGLRSAGAETIYSCLAISNWANGGPVLHVSTKPNADVAKIKSLMKEILQPALGAAFDDYVMGTGKSSVIIAPSKSNLEEVLSGENEGEKLREARLPAEAWTELGHGTLGVIVFGNPDARRVVRELMPRFEQPFEPVNGPLVADHIKWSGLTLTINNENQNAKVVVEATDRESASTIRQAISDAKQLLKGLPLLGPDVELGEAEKKLVLDAIEPRQVGDRVVLSLDKLMEEFESLSKMLKTSISKVKLATVGAARERRLRTIALAVLNYESAHQHFPPAYSVDKNGKPLLSWRVLVLPFIDGQADLFARFKLDEPWDSAHNLPLVKEMPSFLRDSNPTSAMNNATGKTLFQVPFGEGLIFDSGKERQFKDLLDGSSNTLLCVTVANSEAVEWTKPMDWMVDLDDPKAKLQGKDRTLVEAVRCDGSTDSFPLSKSKKYWQQLLLIADGEIPVKD